MQKTTLPPTKNKRSREQWKAIHPKIDFKGKAVLDIGCGYGDILFNCWGAGAAKVTGIEKNKDVFLALYARSTVCDSSLPIDEIGEIELINDDFLNTEWPAVDIITCFSVLPYIKDYNKLLKKIASHSKVALIECQYNGDGPGFDWLENDDDMELWLSEYFFSFKKIGKSLVDYRNKYRSIWLCKSK